jgi:hypothetical protein
MYFRLCLVVIYVDNDLLVLSYDVFDLLILSYDVVWFEFFIKFLCCVCCLFQKMEDHVEIARPFDDIKEINETKDVWTLAMRIVDLWPVIDKYNSEHLEMIVKDAQV